MRKRLLASTAASAVLLAVVMGANGMPTASHIRGSANPAGEFAVTVKKLELTREWGSLWSFLHPGQRAFIPRSLFIRCMSEHRLVSPRPRTIKAVATLSVRASIPGVTRRQVPIKAVRVHVDYGASAPSQTLTTRVARVGPSWHWVTSAGSRTAFVKINFC